MLALTPPTCGGCSIGIACLRADGMRFIPQAWKPMMDMYLSTQETLSLQEMLDSDIKTEIDAVLGGDLSLSLSELPPLDLDDALGGSGDLMWFSGNSCLLSTNSNSSNSNFNFDWNGSEGAGGLVNPNTIMPVKIVSVPSSHATTSSLLMVSSPSSPPESPVVVDDISTPSNMAATETAAVSFARSLASMVSTSGSSIVQTSCPVQTAMLRVSASSRIAPVNRQSLLTTSSVYSRSVTSSTTTTSPNRAPFPPPQVVVTKKQTARHYGDMDCDARLYPKPAYSYSCLIAMALKNSRTGSLPVSEIYNFIEHFPYFKTAPNGWKNSVRHNLSLNKCFEKIEKPTGNSGQRKGCLWAMNPSKIAKMDEEVQKWSKKDPVAIKKAMVYPVLDMCPHVSLMIVLACAENLSLLERGAIKRDKSFKLEPASSPSAEEDDTDSDDQVGNETSHFKTTKPEFVDINHLDDFDESSLTDFEIQVAEGVYEDLDSDEESLNLGVTVRSTASNELEDDGNSASLSKRSRLLAGTIQGNYVYKHVTGLSGAKRKLPPGSSFIKLENP
uniref:Fork-head domain-containing protein n=1 Tax=Timema monikensis TaxID=170555 RepID=A0A7R9E632_9NEOP|nr:unnamed protein product [Timema monikensis]